MREAFQVCGPVCCTEISGIQASPSSHSALAKICCPHGQEGGLWIGTQCHDFHKLISWSFTAQSHPEKSCQTKVGWETLCKWGLIGTQRHPFIYGLATAAFATATVLGSYNRGCVPTEPSIVSLWLSEESFPTSSTIEDGQQGHLGNP